MIEEGSVRVEVRGKVFYNPRMEMNRDITVAVIESLPEVTTYVDAMAASGIRGIRIKKEVSRDLDVTINDWDAPAHELIKENVALNGVSANVTNRGANTLLSSTQYDFVDIDPFGTPSPYIDAVCRASKRAMGVTATDTAPLCGAHLKAGIRTYGAYPVKTDYYSEMGLRILMGKVVREQAKYDRSVRPLLCHATQHYIRLYLSVEHGVAYADKMMQEMGFLAHCFACKDRFALHGLAVQAPEKCPVCGSKMKLAGPLWLGPTKDDTFVEKVIGVLERGQFNRKEHAIRMLRLILNEAEVPFFYDHHVLCRDLKATPSHIEVLLDALRAEGYKASRTHFSGVGFKTDAPLNAIKGIILRLSD
jgi:tRNA (guanine26-N2/guanine27-N2)-dimethyltransferase